MYFYDFNAIEYKKKRERVYFKSMTGEVSHLCIMKFTPGEGYCIPGNVRHGFSVADQPVVYIEIFSPPKKENDL